LNALMAQYDLWLVGLSFLVSVLGSFVGLMVTAIIRGKEGALRFYWIATSAVTLGGVAIWSMHFIGMLAYNPGMPVTYDLATTGLSMLPAIIMTGIGIWIVTTGQFSYGKLVVAGLIVGTGVVIMHYYGMAAVRIQASIGYDTTLFVASVIIAVIAATAALYIAVHATGWMRHASSIVMGVAVCGMHYTGMAAIQLKKSAATIDFFSGAVTVADVQGWVTACSLGLLLIGVLMVNIDSLMSIESRGRRR